MSNFPAYYAILFRRLSHDDVRSAGDEMSVRIEPSVPKYVSENQQFSPPLLTS